ncbi:hypothetical protein DEFDS_P088 (plasmid) [Deferribacter desulfuricans SSM1]|uniref:Uncharacterized protein n=2 Tax=Deferribacter TaxID=53572 RepID=D3PER9_DEFDS|nr:hypothetical protein DEFDS_P088 [Deferribacter desulfuricans SSM1]
MNKTTNQNDQNDINQTNIVQFNCHISEFKYNQSQYGFIYFNNIKLPSFNLLKWVFDKKNLTSAENKKINKAVQNIFLDYLKDLDYKAKTEKFTYKQSLSVPVLYQNRYVNLLSLSNPKLMHNSSLNLILMDEKDKDIQSLNLYPYVNMQDKLTFYQKLPYIITLEGINIDTFNQHILDSIEQTQKNKNKKFDYRSIVYSINPNVIIELQYDILNYFFNDITQFIKSHKYYDVLVDNGLTNLDYLTLYPIEFQVVKNIYNNSEFKRIVNKLIPVNTLTHDINTEQTKTCFNQDFDTLFYIIKNKDYALLHNYFKTIYIEILKQKRQGYYDKLSNILFKEKLGSDYNQPKSDISNDNENLIDYISLELKENSILVQDDIDFPTLYENEEEQSEIINEENINENIEKDENMEIDNKPNLLFDDLDM